MDDLLLTSVALPLKGAAAVPLEVGLRIDGLLDHSAGWTLETASDAGFEHLLSRLARREWRGVDIQFRKMRRQNGLLTASKNGDLNALKWWASSYLGVSSPPLDQALVFKQAAENGHAHILEWLKDQGSLPSDANTCIQTAHPSAVYWLFEHQLAMVIDPSLAARTGDLAFLRWIHDKPQLRKDVVNWHKWHTISYLAALRGHLELVQWIYSSRTTNFTPETLKGAVEGGHVAIAQWAYSKMKFDLSCDLHVVDTSVDMVQWLKNEFEWTSASAYEAYANKTFVDAARLGKLDVLEFLGEEEYLRAFGDQAMLRSVENGHLHVVQWLYERNVGVYEASIISAIQHGRLEVLKWMHERYSGEWPSSATIFAMFHGHLEVLQWLHGQGFATFNAETMRMASHYGSVSILEWLHSSVYRSEWWTVNDLEFALKNGRLDTLKWFCEHSRHVVSISSRGHTIQLTLVAANKSTAFKQVNHEDFALVEWLYQYAEEAAQ